MKLVVVALVQVLLLCAGVSRAAAADGLWWQRTFTLPDGTKKTLLLQSWRNPPVRSPCYVWFEGRCMKLNSGIFGNGPAGLLTSPDGTTVIALRHVEASIDGGVLVDLRSGEMRWEPGMIDWDKTARWTRQSWRTSFEELPREQLFREMLGDDRWRAEVAVEELDARGGFEPTDASSLAAVLGDPDADPDVRARAASMLVRTVKSADEHTLATLATLAAAPRDEDAAFDAPLVAAWALSRLAPDSPGTIDLHQVQRNAQLRDREVGRIRNWWSHRRAVPTATTTISAPSSR